MNPICKLAMVALMAALAQVAHSQTAILSGPSSNVPINTAQSYSVEFRNAQGQLIQPPNGTYSWDVVGGTVNNHTPSSAGITWTAVGSNWIFYEMTTVDNYYFDDLAVTVDASNAPLPPYAQGNGRCGTGQVTLTATPGAGGTTVRWYSGFSFKGQVTYTLLHTGTSYTTPNLSATTSYSISSYNASTGQESTKVEVVATVDSTPANPTVQSAPRFGPGTVQLTASGATSGQQYLWYSPAGDLLYLGSTYSPTVQAAQEDWGYVKIKTTYGCFSDPVWVDVQVYDLPMITTGNDRVVMGGAVTLTAQAGYNSYTWLDSQDTQVGSENEFTTLTPGEYRVRVTKGALEATSEAFRVKAQFDDQNINRVTAYAIRKPGVGGLQEVHALTVENAQQSVNYYDGLGRPIQTVITQGSPTGLDIVQPVVYDAYGREARKYLPVTTGTDGRYKEGLIGTNGLYTGAVANFYTDIPYAQTIFEPSPLNRPVEQGAPGADWQPGQHTVKMAYGINSAQDEVRLWRVTNDQPTSTGFFPAGQLYKNTMEDEDGNQAVEFTDKQGQVVLKRVQVDATQWAETYYVYDIYGQQRVVFQPQAVKILKETNWLVTTALLKELAFTYQYDGRNRPIAKQVPGADTVLMVYDQWDRLVLTQDGNQRTRGEWLFTKYDALNRPVLTGIYENSGDVQTLREAVKNHAVRFETRDNMGTEGYSNTAFPTTGISRYLSVMYYDDYGFMLIAGQWPDYMDYFDEELGETVNGHNYATPTAEHTAIKGQVTGSKVKDLVTDIWLRTVSYYDDRYRPVQAISENGMGGFDRTTTLFDFTGQALQAKTVHYSAPDTIPIEVLKRMQYDHAGRLLATTHQIDDQPEVLLAENEYNELSQMTGKTLGGGVEHVGFMYNIRGWLTDISSGLFTQKLFYNEVDTHLGNTALFNGNISAIWWTDINAVAPNARRGYQYNYDKLGRLTAANHFEGNALSLNATNNFSTAYSFDANGNIQTLQRRGATGSLIDDLSYVYLNNGQSNKLMEVTDASEDTSTFNDMSKTGVDYGYDPNGNMIIDKNKKIDTIYYNHLNIPMVVVMEPVQGKRDSLVYYHDAAGIKLRQDIYQNGVLKKKQVYAGDLYYENDTLKFISHLEGRLVVDVVNATLDYQYNLKDHLGNTRVILGTRHESYTMTATMEDANATTEENFFTNMTDTRVSMAAANHTPGGTKAARVSSTDPIGPMTMLRVNKGDTLKLSVWAYYEGDGSTDGLIDQMDVLAALLTGYQASTGTGEASQAVGNAIESGLDFPQNVVPKSNTTNDDAPKAYLNYMYFDKNMNFITSGFKQISTAAQLNKELVQMDPLVMDREGFVMVYVSNESNELNYVHFDDLTIYHGKTNVVFSSDYYPFGLQYNVNARHASTPVRYKFQEQEHDEATGWIAFKWRNHDPTIGRFFNVDPLSEKYLYNSTYAFSENKVTSHVELEGLEAFDIKIIARQPSVAISAKSKTQIKTYAGTNTFINASIKFDMSGQLRGIEGKGKSRLNAISVERIPVEPDKSGATITRVEINGEIGKGRNATKFSINVRTIVNEPADNNKEYDDGEVRVSGWVKTGGSGGYDSSDNVTEISFSIAGTSDKTAEEFLSATSEDGKNWKPVEREKHGVRFLLDWTGNKGRDSDKTQGESKIKQ
jgi:RHS repeat-associated protein